MLNLVTQFGRILLGNDLPQHVILLILFNNDSIEDDLTHVIQENQARSISSFASFKDQIATRLKVLYRNAKLVQFINILEHDECQSGASIGTFTPFSRAVSIASS